MLIIPPFMGLGIWTANVKYKACMFSAYDFNSYLYVNVFLNGLALVPSVLVNVLCYYSILHKVILKKSFTDLGDNQLFDRSCFFETQCCGLFAARSISLENSAYRSYHCDRHCTNKHVKFCFKGNFESGNLDLLLYM